LTGGTNGPDGASDPGKLGAAPLYEPADFEKDDEDEPARVALRAMLLGLGTDPEEIDQADADGTLMLLGVERLIVPEPARFDLDEVTARTGLTAELVGQLWRSLGHAAPQPGERLFTDTDAEIMAKVGDLIAADEQTAPLVLQMSRVIGSSIARIASAQIDAISGPTGRPGERDLLANERVLRNTGSLLPVMPRVLEAAWRRHLQDAARRRMLQVSSADGQPSVAVGFADLVGFTALSQQADDVELAAIVDQFENLVFDVITAGGGRVVKTIGDEVMFRVASPRAGAEIALALVEGTRASDELSDVRLGMAYGPVLEREGDLYGPVVNLASRITVIALPGTAVVSPEVAEALDGDPAYAVRAMRPRYLKNIGRVRLSVLRRATPVEGRFSDRRQALRDAVKARIDPDPSADDD
jgi:adenylate cyclase